MTVQIATQGVKGLVAVRVTGWDERCVEFVTNETRQRLKERGPVLKLLAARSSESIVVLAPDGTPLLFLGLIPFTLLGGEAYIWMVPFQALSVRHLRGMKKMFEEYAKKFTRLVAQVFYCETQEDRFVKYFGFKPIHQQGDMTIYERKD